MATYPADLLFLFSELKGWSVNTQRLIPVSLQSLSPGNYLTVNLPENTMIDPKSLVIMGDIVGIKGNGSTSGGVQCVLPVGSWSLIDQISVNINGLVIDSSCTSYNVLHKLKWDMTKGNRYSAESVLELTQPRNNTVQGTQNTALPQIGYALSSGAAGAANGTVPSANSLYWAGSTTQNAYPFVLKDFYGFLGQPRMIDCTATGMIQVQFRFAPTDILMQGASTDGTPSYSIQNLRAFINVADVNDGLYYAAMAQRMAQAPVAIPFKKYYSIYAPQLDGTGSVRFSVNSRSVDAVYGILRPANWTPVANTTGYLTPVNSYFARKLSNIGLVSSASGNPVLTAATKWVRSCNFTLNSQLYPTWAANSDELYFLALNTFRQFKEEDVGVNPQMTYAEWHDVLGFASYRFSHDTDLNFVSGQNTLGLSANFTWDITVDAAAGAVDGLNALPTVVCETTALLLVASGRSVSIEN